VRRLDRLGHAPPQAALHYWITQRRWTERESLGPVVEYLLRGPEPHNPALTWVCQPLAQQRPQNAVARDLAPQTPVERTTP
jgi:hypothetical protein